jgi:hypothetical protein
MFQSNKTLIILILICLLFIGALILIYFTFGNKPISKSNLEIASTSVSSSIKTIKAFDEDVAVTQNSSTKEQVLNLQTSSTQLIQSSKTSNLIIPKDQIGFTDDIINKDLNLPESPKINYNFEAKDKEIIGKYIKTVYENKITSILKDDKNSEIVAFKIPIDKIDPQTQKDFPITFKFSNEDRKPLFKDKIFLYYKTEKRIAYLGEYINDIQAFDYESQNYWLILYNNQILLSKPNFSNWKIIDLQDDPVQGLYKKSDFEFQIFKSVSYENFDEYKIETISPQKYIIEGIFKEQLDG